MIGPRVQASEKYKPSPPPQKIKEKIFNESPSIKTPELQKLFSVQTRQDNQPKRMSPKENNEENESKTTVSQAPNLYIKSNSSDHQSSPALRKNVESDVRVCHKQPDITHGHCPDNFLFVQATFASESIVPSGGPGAVLGVVVEISMFNPTRRTR